MTDLPLDPNRKIFRWGPIPCRIFLLSNFMEIVFKEFTKEYGNKWPHSIALFKDKNICWVLDDEHFFKFCSDVFREHMVPDTARKRIEDRYFESLKAAEVDRRLVDSSDLSNMDDKCLMALYGQVLKSANMIVLARLVPEFGGYGSTIVLKEAVLPHVPEAELDSVMEILTAPDEMSFFQQEEIDLVETDNIEQHTKKYCWLKNGYGSVEVLPRSFFEQRKPKLPDNLREEIEDSFIEVRRRKEDVKAKHDIPDDVMHMADVAVKCILWQDHSKMHIHIGLHYMHMFLREVAKRRGLDPDLIMEAHVNELPDILAGKDIAEELKSRARCTAVDDAKGVVFEPEDLARHYWDVYTHEEVRPDTKEFKGTPASKGKATGKVKILMDPYATDTFDQGDILVCPMTSPEYIFAMKKSAAVVTDAGGLTSHAAIVSRELKIPCVVGTRIATQVLKDGQTIEVDAESGIVRVKDD